MKKLGKFLLTLLCSALIAVPVFSAAACGADKGSDSTGGGGGEPTEELIDYASQLKLDLDSNTKKQEVTVRLFVDGDTTHFDPVKNSTLTSYNAADFEDTDGYIKARYIAINTPESTGKIEKWGKTASIFTHDKLANAQKIIVESDTDIWNIDSTGSRYVLWVWYMPKGATEFRNLNVEILQEGLALASNTYQNRYSDTAVPALNQAETNELKVFSPPDTKDDNWFGDEGIHEVTLKELRCHIRDYLQRDIGVTGVVTAEFDHAVYIQDYDAETGVYFGMSVYYGYQTGQILQQLKPGNRVRVVGSITEFNGTYQISGVEYNAFKPNNPKNTTVIETGVEIDFPELSAHDIISGNLSVTFEVEDDEDEVVDLAYGEAVVCTAATLKNLEVIDVYTTKKGTSAGAISLTCKAEDDTIITVRTTVLKDADNKTVTEDKFMGKKITVEGVVDYYDQENNGNGVYQLKLYNISHVFNIDGTPFFG